LPRQILEDCSGLRLDASGRPLESAIAGDLEHAGVVRSYANAVVAPTWDSASSSCGDSLYGFWILQEYCDRGSLAVGAGASAPWLAALVRSPRSSSLPLVGTPWTATLEGFWRRQKTKVPNISRRGEKKGGGAEDGACGQCR
jgi:hypothetical protein